MAIFSRKPLLFLLLSHNIENQDCYNNLTVVPVSPSIANIHRKPNDSSKRSSQLLKYTWKFPLTWVPFANGLRREQERLAIRDFWWQTTVGVFEPIAVRVIFLFSHDFFVVWQFC